MNTLIAIGVLAVLVLIAEIINLRKLVIPMTIIGLVGILGYTVCNIDVEVSYYNNMFITKKFSNAFSSLFIALTIFLVALSKDFYQKEFSKISDYISLKLFLLMGAICMVSFGNMAMFFLGLEILSITLYILCGSDRANIKSNEAAMKYFLLGSFASGIVLFGIALVYGATASFDISEIITITSQGTLPIWYSLGVVMIIIGMLFKIAAVPFHFWAPDVYQGAPTLTTAMMSTLVKVTAVATLFKLSFHLLRQMPEGYITAIVVIAILTMTVGNIMALRQENMKRLLAYSGISHAGFMMMALTALNTSAANLFYYATAYAIAGIAAFTVLMAVTKGKENQLIQSFSGLGKRNPLMAIVLSIALLSMGGIPIFAGFFGKFFLFSEAISKGFITLVIFGVINSFISIYYYLKVIIVMFTNNDETAEETALSIPLSYKIVGVLAVAINIIIGLCPSILLNIFQ
ncbi:MULTISPECIES: NADH-quinone oxidoreductase subunit N [Myroides]|uniref:NADH-quinone oxidoreductase subunit N n=1 Tax=Myroides albus TaxID=2562892 RepID=A0A6I3LGN0_9FLAO|nr:MULTISPECIES: NADH-quinone oxidoreductase subunit N [Myroides]MTG96706.1 NADH-quinone oxidoreductase subunit NuoN [Myroides albus]MVX35652.1 NADH-quinone oxidoreductase subunit NuoN [Myroides sp. LoEW2-1]UVD80882.1 NADH-quinone oxidoreductase subunit N [Myroides albus]